MKFIRSFGAEESGQVLNEYVLLIAFLVFATVAFAASYTKSIAGVTNAVNSNLVAAANFKPVVEPAVPNTIVSQAARLQVR